MQAAKRYAACCCHPGTAPAPYPGSFMSMHVLQDPVSAQRHKVPQRARDDGRNGMSKDVGDASIFLIGAGRVGGALLKGWLEAGFSPGSLAVAEPEPSPEIAALLREKAIAAAPQSAPDVLVLAVKPQVMDTVLPGIAPFAG